MDAVAKDAGICGGEVMEYKKEGLCYICSPYSGNPLKKIRNVKYARKLTRQAIEAGYIPVTPHLYMTQVLNDNIPKERKVGMELGLRLLGHCDTILVGARYGVSDGMAAELSEAHKHDINILIADIEKEKK